jgi:pyruvate,water dikinase
MAGPGGLIRWFDEVGIDDIALVGGKNASLGELYRELVPRGVKVPPGFAVTAEAYRDHLAAGGLEQRLQATLAGLDTRDVAALQRCGRQVRQAILARSLSDQLERAIVEAYDRLSGGTAEGVDVAVRSSATAEDLPDASFAGQQETYLNVRGHADLLSACRRCFASLFTDRAISYRAERGFDHFKVALSIGVQRMVRSDLAASGVMFSIDTETGFRDAVLINAAYGLGENVVQGVVTPDEYCVFKPTLRAGYRPILHKVVGSKEFKLVYDVGGGKGVKNVPVSPGDRTRFAIDDDEILTLARWACTIGDHYSAKRGLPTPMDMEWAKDGLTGELFIVQARPETVQAHRRRDVLETYRLKERGPVLVRGRSVGEKIAAGPVHVIRSAQQLAEFRDGEVLVTERTDPDWEPIMKGLAREEFIISTYIKIHPLALLDYARLDDPGVKAEIDRLTAGYTDKAQFFVDKLAQGVGMIAAAFYPKDVIVRLSDFKSNEYANLIGGRGYEPTEENPMLGFRGASRYYDPRYREGFALECRAMRKVRDEMGLGNVKLMVPFCRTVEEGRRVEAEMARHGLRRGENGLELYVMCEIPSNVVRAEAFAEVFDGFSIGSNDLTQLALGVDRDSPFVAHLFDERDPTVKALVASVIQAARAKGRKIGICGQAPSDYPEFAQFLVEQGIDSISLNPDAVMKTTLRILETEAALGL